MMFRSYYNNDCSRGVRLQHYVRMEAFTRGVVDAIFTIYTI